MKTLVIVGDELESQKIRNIFASSIKGMELTESRDKSHIAKILEDPEHGIDYVILDVQSKLFEPKEYYDVIYKICPKIKFLFLGIRQFIKSRMPTTIFEDNKDNNSLDKPYSADDFIVAFKPLVKEVIKKETVTISGEEVDREHYIPMHIKNFYRFRVIPYDGFLELSPKKFVRVIKADEEFYLESIQKYAKKGIKYIWLKKEEHLIYLENKVHELVKEMSRNHSFDKILRLQMDSVALIHEHIRSIGISDEIEKLCWLIIKKSMNYVEQSKKFEVFFSHVPLEFHDISEKAVLTLYVSLFTLKYQNWESELPRHKIGLASILHDCMLENDNLSMIFSDIDFEIENYSDLDIQEYKNHTVKAAEVAKLFSSFFEVDFIINQHHELPNGDGYPHGLYNNQISGLTAIFIVTNNFSNHLLVGKQLDAEHIKNTLALMENYYFEGNFLKCVQTLNSFFNFK